MSTVVCSCWSVPDKTILHPRVGANFLSKSKIVFSAGGGYALIWLPASSVNCTRLHCNAGRRFAAKFLETEIRAAFMKGDQQHRVGWCRFLFTSFQYVHFIALLKGLMTFRKPPEYLLSSCLVFTYLVTQLHTVDVHMSGPQAHGVSVHLSHVCPPLYDISGTLSPVCCCCWSHTCCC